MNQKTIMILAAATLAVGGIAAIKLSSNEAAVASKNANEKFLPALEAGINDVASITLQKAAGSFTLAKSESGWGLTEKGGYPVDMESVRKTLIALSGMTVLEPKTDDPTRYSKLGVQDPEAEGSTSTLVTLKDKSGKELARVVVGKPSEGHGGAPSGSTYVRKSGEKQSFLVKGDPGLKEKDTDWLEKKILEVKRDRIRSVEVKHPDGEVVLVERSKPEDQNFALLNIPEDQELSYPSAAGSITSTLEYLNLEDVLPADKVDFSQGASATSEFCTFDGLKITVRIKEEAEKCYGRFEVAYEPRPEIGPTLPEPEKKDGEAFVEPAKPAESKKKPEEVKQEAAELQKRLAPWVFVIPSYNKASFTKHMKDLLKPKTPPAPPVPPGGEGKQEGEASEDGAYVIPDNLPPEIQAQIKAHQESLGHKTKVVPVTKPPEEGTPPAPAPDPAPTPTPAPVPDQPPHR